MTDWKEWKQCQEDERSQREQDFIDNMLWKIEAVTDVQLRKNGSYTFSIRWYGVCDFYPKSGKLLVRKDNKWVKNGRNFLKKYFGHIK